MIAEYVPEFLAIIALLTYVLELWIGVAFAGWAGDQSFVERDRSPGPYWFVMGLQTLVLVVTAILIAMNR